MTHWQGKVVAIAGGSRGLGWQIAKSFHRLGASIAIVARDQQQIATVVAELNRLRADSAFGRSVNLAEIDAGKDAVDQVLRQYKKIDVWVNAVGQSIRTDFQQTGIEDYRRLMEQNFFASAGVSLAVLRSLEQSNGHLVNIGSLASKTAWPYLAPYVTSKHALAGFAQQLRLEGPANVHYLFVCSGPIKSMHSTARYLDQARDLPVTAAKPGAGAPTRLIDGEWLADRIVWACEHRKRELVVPVRSRLLFSITQLWPSLGDWLVRRFCK